MATANIHTGSESSQILLVLLMSYFFNQNPDGRNVNGWEYPRWGYYPPHQGFLLLLLLFLKHQTQLAKHVSEQTAPHCFSDSDWKMFCHQQVTHRAFDAVKSTPGCPKCRFFPGKKNAISFLFFVILIHGIQIAHPPLPSADLNKILHVNLLNSLDLYIFSIVYSSICVLYF